MSSEREAPVGERAEQIAEKLIAITQHVYALIPEEKTVLRQAADLLSALSPVRAQEPTDPVTIDDLVTTARHYLGEGWGQPPQGQRLSFLLHALNHLGGIRQDYAKLAAALPPVQATGSVPVEGKPGIYRSPISGSVFAIAQATTAMVEKCESGLKDCGPVEYHDTDGVPLCAKCWQALPPADPDDDETETPAPDLARVRALIEQWRNEERQCRSAAREHDRDGHDVWSERKRSHADLLKKCADDLSAALEGAATKGK